MNENVFYTLAFRDIECRNYEKDFSHKEEYVEKYMEYCENKGVKRYNMAEISDF